ncbi:Nif3-like dinuclear metal center hexameric protein [Clostridium sp. MSJ-8]|uniref:Nif3-like dinuclear metal center hexameric protein n=1 Tax=Clostridium sp. MSJ-8 TaxID=2841510 RepID=UPI001C0ED3AE|nr:Nif3-like dinuclear metal center hexameric protein [Clostridium sp. MSJ-8]MBU5486633.1 Nif3-like dinuclear metal center hexameric protein [Clostridium sp. MSJ-8]
MKVKDIIKEMEKLAPPFLKESYDNVGLMVGDEEKDVQKILLALDCTKEVINEAILNNIDLIITHHPLIFRKPSRIVMGDLQGEKIISLIKNDISLYSSHTNLDTVKGGINETIVKMLGFGESKIIDEVENPEYKGSGIGRIVKLSQEKTPQDIIDLVKNKLNVENLRVVIGDKPISKIAIINGSGQDYFSDAVRYGADCIITGDTTYHYASDYKEMGITIIDPGHFKTEWIIFLEVMKNIESKFTNIEFMHSRVSNDPYEFF